LKTTTFNTKMTFNENTIPEEINDVGDNEMVEKD
jgi:hypothetical protein